MFWTGPLPGLWSYWWVGCHHPLGFPKRWQPLWQLLTFGPRGGSSRHTRIIWFCHCFGLFWSICWFYKLLYSIFLQQLAIVFHHVNRFLELAMKNTQQFNIYNFYERRTWRTRNASWGVVKTAANAFPDVAAQCQDNRVSSAHKKDERHSWYNYKPTRYKMIYTIYINHIIHDTW